MARPRGPGSPRTEREREAPRSSRPAPATRQASARAQSQPRRKAPARSSIKRMPAPSTTAASASARASIARSASRTHPRGQEVSAAAHRDRADAHVGCHVDPRDQASRLPEGRGRCCATLRPTPVEFSNPRFTRPESIEPCPTCASTRRRTSLGTATRRSPIPTDATSDDGPIGPEVPEIDRDVAVGTANHERPVGRVRLREPRVADPALEPDVRRHQSGGERHGHHRGRHERSRSPRPGAGEERCARHQDTDGQVAVPARLGEEHHRRPRAATKQHSGAAASTVALASASVRGRLRT